MHIVSSVVCTLWIWCFLSCFSLCCLIVSLFPSAFLHFVCVFLPLDECELDFWLNSHYPLTKPSQSINTDTDKMKMLEPRKNKSARFRRIYLSPFTYSPAKFHEEWCVSCSHLYLIWMMDHWCQIVINRFTSLFCPLFSSFLFNFHQRTAFQWMYIISNGFCLFDKNDFWPRGSVRHSKPSLNCMAFQFIWRIWSIRECTPLSLTDKWKWFH